VKTYKIRVNEPSGNSHRKYNAQVSADNVHTDGANNLIFSDKLGGRLAIFATGTWVYFKLIVDER
jgi:hypothetical protein